MTRSKPFEKIAAEAGTKEPKAFKDAGKKFAPDSPAKMRMERKITARKTGGRKKGY